MVERLISIKYFLHLKRSGGRKRVRQVEYSAGVTYNTKLPLRRIERGGRERV